MRSDDGKKHTQADLLSDEWLETDSLGGFSSGTIGGARTRRYHALLLTATRPPGGRMVLVNGFEAWVETPSGRYAITSQGYDPDVLHPDGAGRIDRFVDDPWPTWRFRLEDGTVVEQEIFVPAGRAAVCVAWRVIGKRRRDLRLTVRPLMSGRDYHSLHRENPAFRFDSVVDGETVLWRPYDGVPGVVSRANAHYEPAPEWYRRFLYVEERDRGLDCLEDLASPGMLHFDLASGEAAWLLEAGTSAPRGVGGAVSMVAALRESERSRRRRFPSRLHRAASAYKVVRDSGESIIAGYPWFTDWGRDTFIALRGLCLATGDLGSARRILLEWSRWVSEGMLPNRFPDRGEQPEFNSVDASLWYIVAVGEFLEAAAGGPDEPDAGERRSLLDAVLAILSGYMRGTRHGIRLGADGLLAAGEPGVQLTWMDAKVGDWVVTPRIGKPVEVQALWLNALEVARRFSSSRSYDAPFEKGLASFLDRFWNEEAGCLHDVIDVDHRPGAIDASFRPNQILAVGGLPLQILEGERARRLVDAVEARLLTTMGLRSLAPGEPGYAPRYEGGVVQRDGAYHQGIVWPWLMGPFAEAWVRVRGGTAAARRSARARFLVPLMNHMAVAGIGHISEIADAEAPHAPRGCPFQAWSVGEALRLDQVVLAPRPKAGARWDRSTRGRAVARTT